MEYVAEIWMKMADKAIDPMFSQLLTMGARIGWKAKKGEQSLPAEMVRDMLKEAYRSGAQAALKMQQAVDGEE